MDPAPWIISCIKEGYKLPLRFIPGCYRKPNQQSALRHQQFVQQAIQELEQNHCVVKVQEVPHICSSLSVVANAQGKLQLVLNLCWVCPPPYLVPRVIQHAARTRAVGTLIFPYSRQRHFGL